MFWRLFSGAILLLTMSASLTFADDNETVSFFQALKSCDSGKIEEFLKNGFDPNAPYPSSGPEAFLAGFTPVSYTGLLTCSPDRGLYGNVEKIHAYFRSKVFPILSLLKKYGADLNKKAALTYFNDKPIIGPSYMSIFWCDLAGSYIESYLRHAHTLGADFTLTDTAGHDVLFAYLSGMNHLRPNMEFVDYLLKEGVDPQKSQMFRSLVVWISYSPSFARQLFDKAKDLGVDFTDMSISNQISGQLLLVDLYRNLSTEKGTEKDREVGLQIIHELEDLLYQQSPNILNRPYPRSGRTALMDMAINFCPATDDRWGQQVFKYRDNYLHSPEKFFEERYGA
ncbi:MAG: hypothetical protein WCG27_11675, partial [Pseudomonadota bacterium]